MNVLNTDPRRMSLGARTARRFAALAGAVCLLAFVAGAAGAGDAGPSFAAGPPIPAGPAPASAAVADLNGDGKLDLAVGNGGYWKDVRILLGNGAGGFSAAGSPVAIGDYPRAMTSADFNGDGNADLAVGSLGSDVVRILLGNGLGGVTAAPGSPVGAGGEPMSVTPADLNRDGKVDLVVPVRQNGFRITILVGDGSGRFAPAAGSVPIGGGEGVSVVVADFNGDGKPDVAVANNALNDVSLLPGDGSGGFGQATTILAVRRPGSLAVGDFNGDGRADLLAVVGSGTVALLGNGAGAFRRAGAPVAVRGTDLAIADFNGDGKADFAAANADANRIGVALGNGAGGFRAVGLSPFSALLPVQVAAGDFNGDQKTDVLALSAVGTAWWPAPPGSAILLQTPSTPPVLPAGSPRTRPALFSTRGAIKLFAADGNRAAVLTGKVKNACGRIVVWTAPRQASRSFKPGYLGCQGDGVSELAVGGGQVAWIEQGGGNNLELSVMAARLSGRPRQIDYVVNGDRAGGDPQGDWVGLLLGGGSLIAYNAWEVVCTHEDPEGGYCDWLGVGQRELVRISGGKRAVVRGGPDSYPLEAVGGGRMAVESDGLVSVYAPNGAVVAVPAASDDPPRAIALSSSRLALERTFRLDLYNSATASRVASLPLGPAAALRLVAVNKQLALLRGPGGMVLVRLADGKSVSLPLRSSAGTPIVGVGLTEAGLFSAYNVPRAAAKGRIAFEPTARLLRRF